MDTWGKPLNSTVGVIGCGQMGLGITQVAAIAGHTVLLYDIDANARIVGLEKIKAALAKLHLKNKISDVTLVDSEQSIQIIDSLGQLQKADLIIEAIKEDYVVKEQLFEKISKINATAVIATNTSALSITRLSNSVKNAQRFIGIHFMNPVPIMPLVEIIVHEGLSNATLDFATNFCISLQKQVVKCQDSPGFIVNRLLLPVINQAIVLFEQGIATCEDIDLAMRLGANFPMGPLALADFIGLDTCLFILQTLYAENTHNSMPPANLLINMVSNGKLGKKSGQGFYEYS